MASFNAKTIVKDKRFWVAAFLIVWAAGLQCLRDTWCGCRGKNPSSRTSEQSMKTTRSDPVLLAGSNFEDLKHYLIATTKVLLKIIQSEFQHEISTPRFQKVETGNIGDFKLEWDSWESKDIVLRRQFESGEEVVVSALLEKEPIEDEDTMFPRAALAKVCIRKPGLTSILQFDCLVNETGPRSSDFEVEGACFIPSASSSSAPSSTYGGHFFHTIDMELHGALKRYLRSKGVSEGLTSFLLCHLNKKEQDQYVNWLRRLESTVSHHL